MTKAIKSLLVSIWFVFIIFFITSCSPSEIPEAAPSQVSVTTQPTLAATSTLPSTDLPEITPTESPTVPPPTSTPKPSPTTTSEPVQETISLTAEDTYIYLHPNASGTNYGHEDTIILGGDSDGNAYKVLLNFDTADYIPPNAKILDASLQITAVDDVFWGFPFTINPITTSWDEYTVTADTHPSFDSATVIEQTLDEANRTTTFSLTDLVQQWSSEQIPDFGILLSANVFQNTERFYAKEGFNAATPSLVITYETGSEQIVEASPPDDGPTQVDDLTIHLQPDLLLELEPWDDLKSGIVDDLFGDGTDFGLAKFAENADIDVGTVAGISQYEILLNNLLQVEFGGQINYPIAIANHPDITIESVMARIPDNGILHRETPTINLYEGAPILSNCKAPPVCANPRILSYSEGDLSIQVSDGFMQIIMARRSGPQVSLLDTLNTDYEGVGTADDANILDSLLFFKIMHETFGIPHESIEIYPYNSIREDDDKADVWPTKYLAVYWASDREIVVPRTTEGDLANLYKATLDYDIRINATGEPFVFRRWFDPVNVNSSILDQPEHEMDLVVLPCSEPCTKSLFDNEQFHSSYYDVGGYPYESVQIELNTEPQNSSPYWLIAYLTDQPFVLDE